MTIQEAERLAKEEVERGERRVLIVDEAEGLGFLAPKRSCGFCKYCSHIVWDFEHGPYMVSCEVDADTQFGYYGQCEHFEEDIADNVN